MFQLSLATIGEIYTIKRITGNNSTKNFLEELGFIENEKLELVSIHKGDVIVSIKDSRIALNEDIAKHILVV